MSLTVLYLQSPFCHIKYHIHRFSGLGHRHLWGLSLFSPHLNTLDWGSCFFISPPRTDTCPCLWPRAKILDSVSDSLSQTPSFKEHTWAGTGGRRFFEDGTHMRGERDALVIARGYFLFCSYNNYYISFSVPKKGFNCVYCITTQEVNGPIFSRLTLE